MYPKLVAFTTDILPIVMIRREAWPPTGEKAHIAAIAQPMMLMLRSEIWANMALAKLVLVARRSRVPRFPPASSRHDMLALQARPTTAAKRMGSTVGPCALSSSCWKAWLLKVLVNLHTSSPSTGHQPIPYDLRPVHHRTLEQRRRRLGKPNSKRSRRRPRGPQRFSRSCCASQAGELRAMSRSFPRRASAAT